MNGLPFESALKALCITANVFLRDWGVAVRYEQTVEGGTHDGWDLILVSLDGPKIIDMTTILINGDGCDHDLNEATGFIEDVYKHVRSNYHAGPAVLRLEEFSDGEH